LAVATLAVLAWGAFAFGSVYPWTFGILAAGCALIGLGGLVRGERAFADTRWLLWALTGIGVVGLLQQIPLPPSVLDVVSPGTLRFLTEYDFNYQLGAGPPHPVSLSPTGTWVGLMLLTSFAVFLAGLIRSMSSGAVMRVVRGIVILGAVLAVVGVSQYAIVGDHATGGMRIYGLWRPESLLTTPFGPFVNKNHFAGWMLMALPLGFGLAMGEYEGFYGRPAKSAREWLMWLSTPQGGQSLLLVFATALMAFSLVMTRSRSGLGGLAAIAVMASVVAARRLQSKKVGIGVAIATVAGGALIVMLAGSESALTQTRIQASPLGMRLDVWRMSLQIVRDFLVLGTGLNTFGTATILYQRSGDLHFYEAHNDYLQLLVEGGLVTALIVLTAMLALLAAIRRRFREDRLEPDLYWARVGAALGLVAIGLQSLVEFSLQMPGNAALFTVLVAVALYSPRQSPHSRNM
jgi:hypothetical protein